MRRLIVEVRRDPPISGVASSSDEFVTRELNPAEIDNFVDKIESLVLLVNSRDKWQDNLVQFARLLAEITATHQSIDYSALAESMDLEYGDVVELFDRAHEVWEAAKEEV